MGFSGLSNAADRSFYCPLMVMLLLSCFSFTSIDAYDPLDPNGNITITWDLMSWTPDGYVAVVSIHNFQLYRHIQAPGWTLGWTWPKKEVIWSIFGSKTTEQGNCSKFEGNVPQCCKKNPTVVDLFPDAPYDQQIANCCKGGVLSSQIPDPNNAVSSFQVTVGASGTTNVTVKLPKNFTLLTPGPGYTCGKIKMVKPTRFLTADGRRVTQALMTWKVVCTYSQFLVQRNPSCCVSFSSFYNDTIVSCPSCTCGCQNNATKSGSCVDPKSLYSASNVSKAGTNNPYEPLVQCTSHMCPIAVHWHIKQNYKEHWKVEITVTNFNYRMNYSQWNLVVQHPNLDNITQSSNFSYKSLTPYDDALNDTTMFWGVKSYNDILLQAAGSVGNIQSELLLGKDPSFTFEKGWAFPTRFYFNGDNCPMPPAEAYQVTPPADAYQVMPDSSPAPVISPSASSGSVISLLAAIWTTLPSLVFLMAWA